MAKILTDELIPPLKAILTTPIKVPFQPIEGIAIRRDMTYRVGNILYVSLYLETEQEIPAAQYDVKIGTLDVTTLGIVELSYSFNNDERIKWSRAAFSGAGLWLVKAAGNVTAIAAHTSISISGAVIVTG